MHSESFKKNVLVIGVVPPPIGGVSIYTQRLIYRLKSEGFNVDLINLVKLNIFKKAYSFFRTLFIRNYTIHLNVISTWPMLACIFKPVQNHIIFHLHGVCMFENMSFLNKLIFKTFLKRCAEIRLEESHIEEELHKVNIYPQKEKIKLVHPFIEPDTINRDKYLSEWPEEIISFVRDRSPSLSANAFQLEFFNSEDLYGIDLLVEAIHNLKPKYPNIGLTVAMSQIGDENYYQNLLKKVKSYGIEKNVMITHGNRQAWPIFEISDIMIRPTNTDGGGISIMEAISLGTLTIASDVCPRPKETILFKNRCAEDLTSKIESAIKQLKPL